MASPVVTTRILRRLLSSGVTARAERLLERIHPADLGPLLSDLTPDEIRAVIDMLFRQRRAATTLRELPPELLPQVFDAVTDERLAQVLSRLEIDDMLELAEAIPEERHDDVMALLPEEQRLELRKAELYEPDTAGRVMTTSFVALDEKMTAEEAIDSIRAVGETSDSILYLYVVDEARQLRGVVPIRRLVAAPPDRSIREIMIDSPISVTIAADQEEVANLVARYDLLAVPVTSEDGEMLGVITIDDIIDVITEEATEDMYHLAGLSEEDRVFTPARQSIRKRLPWMLVNLCTAFAAASVVGFFERTLEQVVALAIFLPVVAGMGGNGGVQTLTVITRAIALGEIEFSSGIRAMLKEMAVGLTIGAVVGMLAAGLAYVWQGNPWLGGVLFVSMVITMAFAGLLGASVPLALKALKQDPALGSGVIVTSGADMVGFLAFLGIATLLLDNLV
ncbi:MAG: magnesium transporter [Proteobacteria bacterium]|nr:magnesium transporter [Pseudomonadota bacterium]